MSFTCTRCSGLVVEPGEVVGWGGKFCYCGFPSKPDLSKLETTRPCNCVGPQGGQPLCPCSMAGVTVKDGRYVRITDLGPAS